MVSVTRQRFLALDGDDTPEPMVVGNQDQDSDEQSKKSGKSDSVGSDESGGIKSAYPTGERNNSLNLGKLKAQKSNERAKRKSSRNSKTKAMGKAEKRSPGEHLTFAPGPEERARMVKTLGYKANNRDRTKLERRLTTEFIRIYKRRRRVVQPGAEVLPEERKYATRAGRLCVLKSVTPTQLIDYWEENAGNFTGMRFPALNFLATAGNVDRVSVEVAIAPRKGKRKKSKQNRGSPEIHAYGGELDPRLRPGLVEAEIIEGGEISDRYLMTVQTTAQSLANGRHLFVSSTLKPMVDWALQNLYAD